MEPSLSQRYLHRHAAGPSVASRRCDPPGRRQLPNSRKPAGGRHTEEETMNRFDDDAEQYVRTVLNLYQQLPETPALPSSRDLPCPSTATTRTPSVADRDGFPVGFFAATPATTRSRSLIPNSFPSLLRAGYRRSPPQSRPRHFHQISSAQNAALRREKSYRAREIGRAHV